MTDDTQWLDDEEMRIFRAFLAASSRVSNRLTDSLKQRSGLTLDDYEVLVHLSASEEDRLRMSELSRHLLHSQSRLTQRVDRLTKRGFVTRERCSDDGRGMFACLTDTGRSELKKAAPGHLSDVRASLIDHIEPSERAVLATVLERIAAAEIDQDTSHA